MPRFTKEVIQTLLDQNEGFERTTYYKDRNFREDNHYRISGGNLYIRRIGKTSWSDSKFDEEELADVEQARKFVKKFYDDLNCDGVE
ncbi:hypothetical protein [Pontibacillus yanchengensis]|uniref:Uncharacterized protein n=1 Tax=Pontibacillus yanchengensis Y32 TaxID=1385514 RepID=A0A0A2TWW9_9BACI|nr:hypothetical protein [Pontibacillus yanchengensis]KGP73750.1 hypothetical protein N782_02320 [Pontibacillus yanchengensis Y32]